MSGKRSFPSRAAKKLLGATIWTANRSCETALKIGRVLGIRKLQTAVAKKADDEKSHFAEESIFRDIFLQNAWGSEESHSGTGSTLAQTEVIRVELPRLVKEHQIKTFLDLPCGDFNWMRHLDLGVKKYIGGDIVEDLVAGNAQKYGGWGRKFRHLDLLTSRLPKADLIFCRDCLVHLCFEDVQRAIDNLHRSRIRYLLTTTFTGRVANSIIRTGHWTPYNLQAPPFCFPEPIEIINENCTTEYPDYNDKSLGLWRIKDLPQQLALENIRKAA